MKELLGFVEDLVFHQPDTTPRVRVVKGALWFILGAAATVAVARFTRGLGSTTHLTNATPWGLWIGFDVLGGVALAAGGFLIAATVYIFHLHKYHAIVRPAVLTAFLGYGAVITGLIFDLGLPWNIWRVTIYWNEHSALFEVAWCVMLYFTVLFLEFAPVVIEKMPFPRLFAFFKKITLPLVILGIMLSTLHQSSLGTLFLIMPFRLYPLWYSPILPYLFLISAVGLGLAMVIMESTVTSWLYGRKPELPLLQGVGRAAAVVLTGYALLRLGDLAVQGKLALLLRPNWETALFTFEMLLSAVVPAVLFGLPRTRRSASGLGIAAAMVVLGFVLNRIDVSGIATITVTGTNYFPSWTEFAVSLGVVSGAGLVFFFFVERFGVYETESHAPAEAVAVPPADPVSGVRLGTPWVGDSALFTVIFVLAAGLAFAFLPRDAVEGAHPQATLVEPAKTITALKFMVPGKRIQALSLPDEDPSVTGEPRQVLLIDANHNGRFVLFDHQAHQQRNGDQRSCRLCHHLNLPLDEASSCARCHRDMYLETNIFSHDRHAALMGGNPGCGKCHEDPNQPKNRQTAKACLTCHQGMRVEGSRVKPGKDPLRLGPAAGYMSAMHGMCQNCHQEALAKRPDLAPDLPRCATCHRENDLQFLRRLPPYVEKNQSLVTRGGSDAG